MTRKLVIYTVRAISKEIVARYRTKSSRMLVVILVLNDFYEF